MKIQVKLTETGMPKEPGIYICNHAESNKMFPVLVFLHPEDKVLVIGQFSSGRVFIQNEEDKGFFWSEKIEIGAI